MENPITELLNALRNDELYTIEADGRAPVSGCHAAIELAKCFGYCRLFGVDLGESDGTLTTNVANAAARIWYGYIRGVVDTVATLNIDWVMTPDANQSDEFVVLHLEQRTDLLAVQIALNEARDASAAEFTNVAHGFRLRMQEAEPLLSQLDYELRKNIEILATAVETDYWTETRGAICQEYGNPLPWWLGEEVLKHA